MTIVQCSANTLRTFLHRVLNEWRLRKLRLQTSAATGICSSDEVLPMQLHGFDFRGLGRVTSDETVEEGYVSLVPTKDLNCRRRSEVEEWIGALLDWSGFWQTFDALGT